MPLFFVTRDRGTIKAAVPFTPDVAVERLYKAFKGIGTDDKVVIEICSRHNFEQRMIIKTKYQEKYNKDLIKALKSELSGNYENVAIALFTDPEQYIVENIHNAMKGIGTNEQSLIGLLVGRTNEEMDAIQSVYQEKYGHELAKDLAKELKGEFQKLMLAILLAKRDDNQEVQDIKAEADARRLHTGGVKLGDDSVFDKILTTRSYPQLRATFEAYLRVTGKTIDDSIKSEFKGDMETALLAIVDHVKDQAQFYADRFQYAFKGLGTKDTNLIRLVVLRCEIDLQDVKIAYADKYGKELAAVIGSETSGDYKKILLSLVN